VVSSSRNRLTARSTARLVSLARGGAKSCSSVCPSTTRGFGAAPDPLVPPHPHRRAEARGVVQDLDVPAVADRDHPAVRTTGQISVGLNVQHHQTLFTANVGIAGG